MSPQTFLRNHRNKYVHYRLIGNLTITNTAENSVKDAGALALAALGFILADDRLAARFLDLSGLTPDGLRAAIAERSTHRAILEFLCSHEPDLIRAADSLGILPARIAAALENLKS